MLRLINPRDPFADVHIFWMWLLKVRLLLISTPKYLEPQTDSRIWPYSRYSLGTGFLARVTWMTTHLLGLNSVSHAIPIHEVDQGPAVISEHLKLETAK